MRNKTQNKQGGVNSPLMAFLKKYGLILVLGLLGIPYLYRYYVDAEAKDKKAKLDADQQIMQTQVGNPAQEKIGLDLITTRVDLQDIARNVAFNLGTNIQTKNAGWLSWLNPRGWTENDLAVYNELKKINYAASRDLVAQCYYFLTQRDLLVDVKALLDEEYKQKLPLFK